MTKYVTETGHVYFSSRVKGVISHGGEVMAAGT